MGEIIKRIGNVPQEVEDAFLSLFAMPPGERYEALCALAAQGFVVGIDIRVVEGTITESIDIKTAEEAAALAFTAEGERG